MDNGMFEAQGRLIKAAQDFADATLLDCNSGVIELALLIRLDDVSTALGDVQRRRGGEGDHTSPLAPA